MALAGARRTAHERRGRCRVGVRHRIKRESFDDVINDIIYERRSGRLRCLMPADVDAPRIAP